MKDGLNVDQFSRAVPYVLVSATWCKRRLQINQGRFSRCMEFSTGVSARPTKDRL